MDKNTKRRHFGCSHEKGRAWQIRPLSDHWPDRYNRTNFSQSKSQIKVIFLGFHKNLWIQIWIEIPNGRILQPCSRLQPQFKRLHYPPPPPPAAAMKVRPILLDIVTSADCSNFPQFHNSGMFYPRYLSFDFSLQIPTMSQTKAWQGAKLSKVQICNIPKLPFQAQGAINAFCEILTTVILFMMTEFWKLATDFHFISRE